MKNQLAALLLLLFGALVTISGVYGMSIFGTMNNSVITIPTLPKGMDITVLVGIIMLGAGWMAYRGKA